MEITFSNFVSGTRTWTENKLITAGLRNKYPKVRIRFHPEDSEEETEMFR